MVIQHNISAVNSYRNLSSNQSALSKNLEKLSSGYRINRAADDAAGLAISESMRSKINGLDQATQNANEAIGLIQTEEGALTEVHSMLQRMTTLATQAANGTYNETSRGSIQKEMDELTEEIDRIANNTEYNGIKPLSAEANTGKDSDGKAIDSPMSMTMQIGATKSETLELKGANMTVSGIFASIAASEADDATDKIAQSDTTAAMTAAGADMSEGAKYLQVESATTLKAATADAEAVTLTSNANKVVNNVQKAIDYVSSYRAELGAKQNRLEHTINNLKVTSENTTAAESRIRDTDMAKEIAAYTKNNVLQQAAQSMLSQANQSPQGVLSLLQ